ncbi:unnamed protein product [Caenorhabditis angaria]|uniref:Uncharacterized protein n=1 Tax=Caenorhabditis angaria TaxID=860376 RepID=A0A9P1MZY8_9PELO|nr:unnamed protein product [Caenorhabditis angaria]
MPSNLALYCFLSILILILPRFSESQVRKIDPQSPPPIHIQQHRYDFPQNRCFSCMSKMYEMYFDKVLSSYLYRPLNFTSACDENPDTSKLQLVKCRSICLTIVEEFHMLGKPTGDRLFMRGCALTMTKRGISNKTMAFFDRYDRCRNVSANEMFPHADLQMSPLRVCSCLGDRCNGAAHNFHKLTNYLSYSIPFLFAFLEVLVF